ncbi:hypothetical protein TsFJ059_004974 [Trichoderma semiorbis]|uniref:Ketosynthase family 3 (KS3) domain-containing protein n=1 Tax=Trichoderma semiorbis TaxID=1491008 RepID=A0A9P8HSS6_9HYPO|nr:hypothetical protein TsFJ059_004974 [Trichoderma semiorbis]
MAASQIFVFGPQALSFNATSFESLHGKLHSDPFHSWALDALSALPETLALVSKEAPKLQQTNGLKALEALRKALQTGVVQPDLIPLPNILLSPLVVVSQLVDYVAFLEASEPNLTETSKLPIPSNTDAKTLGLCTGLLSAFAVASAGSVADLQKYGAASVRYRIAVIGMSCQVPNAEDLESFWDILLSGESQHSEVLPERFSMNSVFRDVDPKRKWYGNWILTTMPSIPNSSRRAPERWVQQILSTVLHCSSRISLTLDTACSSSTVAIHLACRAILSGEITSALAGGVNLMTSPEWYLNLAGASFLSPTGQCKSFDSRGDGYCCGEGAGLVFLKKLSAAIADGDQIFGVIAGTSVLQNENPTPITVPNAPSLDRLFRGVVKRARMKPHDITVVEAHGTGTSVGDPAEYDGIRRVLGGPTRPDRLALTAVKGSIGHLEVASGIASLVKVLLMIHKAAIPAQASFQSISPGPNAKPEDNINITTTVKP